MMNGSVEATSQCIISYVYRYLKCVLEKHTTQNPPVREVIGKCIKRAINFIVFHTINDNSQYFYIVPCSNNAKHH